MATSISDFKLTASKTSVSGRSRGTYENVILYKFMESKEYPSWFRGLSVFQLRAADSLLNCLRDDTQQGTCYRVQRACSTIGLSPALSSAKVKRVMRISRGNDLAFLWFLMELYYDDTCKNCNHPVYEYNMNEQIIMSSIAHLDMITTLRELDKILPQQPKQLRSVRKPPPKPPKKTYALPYFEPLKAPQQRRPRVCTRHTHGPVILGYYQRYTDPNHVVCNEMNRWYANYQLHQGRRVVRGIISDQIQKVVNGDMRHGLMEGPSLCEHHQHELVEAKRKDMKKKVRAKAVCFEHFDTRKRRVEATRREFLKDVENAQMPKVNPKLENNNFTDGFDLPKELWRCDKMNKQFDEQYIGSYDYGHQYSAIVKDERYFKSPQPNKPYKFNYSKIFEIPESDPVKAGLKQALEDKHLTNEDVAINRTSKNMWHDAVRLSDKRTKEEELAKKAEKVPEKRYKFERTYYNPRDKKLMTEMLIDALNEMKKNPKFVLASLPDCHKVPVLREWIKARYGFVYTREEKDKHLNVSKRIFYELRKHGIPIMQPQVADLGNKSFVSYKCRDYLRKKSDRILQEYYHNCKMSLLDSIRIFWGAVQPFHCSAGPPRTTFFAYMPSKVSDMFLFRPHSTWINLPHHMEVITKKVNKSHDHN